MGEDPFFDFWFDTGIFAFVVLGMAFVNGGMLINWRIKQIWLYFDPERTLMYEPFDYFQWTDDEQSNDIDTEIFTDSKMDDIDEEGNTSTDTESTEKPTDAKDTSSSTDSST